MNTRYIFWTCFIYIINLFWSTLMNIYKLDKCNICLLNSNSNDMERGKFSKLIEYIYIYINWSEGIFWNMSTLKYNLFYIRWVFGRLWWLIPCIGMTNWIKYEFIDGDGFSNIMRKIYIIIRILMFVVWISKCGKYQVKNIDFF